MTQSTASGALCSDDLTQPCIWPRRHRPRLTPQVEIKYMQDKTENANGGLVSELQATLRDFERVQAQQIKDFQKSREGHDETQRAFLTELRILLENAQKQFQSYETMLREHVGMTEALLGRLQCTDKAGKCPGMAPQKGKCGPFSNAATYSFGHMVDAMPQARGEDMWRGSVMTLANSDAMSEEGSGNGASPRFEKCVNNFGADSGKKVVTRKVAFASLREEEDRRTSEHHHHLDRPTRKAGFFGDLMPDTPLDEEDYDVADFYHKSGMCQALARSDVFQNITLAVIWLNTVYIGVDADNNNANQISKAHPGFQVCENLFAMFFTGEWIIRFLAFRDKRDCWKDMWFKFDTVLVLMMVFETWIMFALQGAIPSVPIGLTKMLRLLRIFRMTRLMRSFPELVAMIKGVKVASRAVGSALSMVAFNVYIFSIIMHMILEDTDMSKRLGYIMWDMLVDGTFLDAVGLYTRALIANRLWLALFVFMCFTILSAMMFMNMLIGVLCEVVSAVAATEKENDAIQLVKGNLLTLLKNIDDNGNGWISRAEIKEVAEDPVAMDVFHSLHLHAEDLLDRLDFHYETQTELPIVQIMDLILMLRGDRPVTMKDMVMEAHYNRWKLLRDMRTVCRP